MRHKIYSEDKILRSNGTSLIVLLVLVIIIFVALNIYNFALMLEDEEFVGTLL